LRRKVPKKTTLVGNRRSSDNLRKLADSQLFLLEQDMRLSPSRKRIGRRVVHGEGYTIDCRVVNGVPEVRITTPPPPVGGPAPRLYRECFCNCNFATGLVTDYYDELRWPDPNARYTVEVCNKKNEYIIFEGCGMTDFTEILPVSEITDETSFVSLVMLYDNTEKVLGNCLEDGSAGSTACCPAIETGLDLVEDQTIYKIIPFQNVNYVQWLSENLSAEVLGCT
jgi:hypothetical protein